MTKEPTKLSKYHQLKFHWQKKTINNLLLSYFCLILDLNELQKSVLLRNLTSLDGQDLVKTRPTIMQYLK